MATRPPLRSRCTQKGLTWVLQFSGCEDLENTGAGEMNGDRPRHDSGVPVGEGRNYNKNSVANGGATVARSIAAASSIESTTFRVANLWKASDCFLESVFLTGRVDSGDMAMLVHKKKCGPCTNA